MYNRSAIKVMPCGTNQIKGQRSRGQRFNGSPKLNVKAQVTCPRLIPAMPSIETSLLNSIQLFHACLVNSQNYATSCRGQLNALLPEAARPRAIVHWAVHGTKGIVLNILPNRHEITVLLHNRT